MAELSMRRRNLKLALFILIFLRRKKRCRRNNYTRTWVKSWIMRRYEQGVYHNLINELRDEDPTGFRWYFRLNKENFQEILSFVSHDITKNNTKMRASISAGERLSITLRFLATGESLHFAYRVGERTISEIVSETCEAIYHNMRDVYLQAPSSEAEWEEVAKNFEDKWNYPCCVGSIDGKHIAIKQPPGSGSLYFNYKHFFSIVLLALVDANYKFMYVDVGAVGRSGDAGIYGNSTLKHLLDTNQLNLPDSGILKGTNTSCKFHFIGDDAFGLSERMMKPYSHRQLEKEKQIFNYRLSRARRVVENAFGILTNRFGVFQTAINLPPEKVEMIVLAACCLHNYLVANSMGSYAPQALLDSEDDNHNLLPGEWRSGLELTALQATHQRNASRKAKDQRDNLKLYFDGKGAVQWQENMIV